MFLIYTSSDTLVSLFYRVWTCLEYAIINEVELLRDRHLDQLIMCSVFVMSLVSNEQREFAKIMECYCGQSQAATHVSSFTNKNTEYWSMVY